MGIRHNLDKNLDKNLDNISQNLDRTSEIQKQFRHNLDVLDRIKVSFSSCLEDYLDLIQKMDCQIDIASFLNIQSCQPIQVHIEIIEQNTNHRLQSCGKETSSSARPEI